MVHVCLFDARRSSLFVSPVFFVAFPPLAAIQVFQLEQHGLHTASYLYTYVLCVCMVYGYDT